MLLFMLYNFNYEVFLTSLNTFVLGGFAQQQIVIIDNSEDKRVANDIRVRRLPMAGIAIYDCGMAKSVHYLELMITSQFVELG